MVICFGFALFGFFSFIDLYSSFSPEMPESKKEEQRENTFTPVIGILSQVRKFFTIIGQRNILNVWEIRSAHFFHWKLST